MTRKRISEKTRLRFFIERQNARMADGVDVVRTYNRILRQLIGKQKG